MTSQSCTYVPPVYTITVNKYVNVEGAKGSFTRTVDGWQALDICVADLGLSGVDPQRIALRDASSGGQIGTYIAFSASGCASFTPTASKAVDAFAFSTLGGTADYAKVNGGRMVFARSMTVYNSPLHPGTAAELQSLASLLVQFNLALARGGMTSGTLTSSDGGGDLQVRFGSSSFCGSHTTFSPLVVSINSSRCQALSPVRNIIGVMVEEFFEILTGLVDIDGGGSFVNGPDDASITERGKAFLTYVYIRDSKGW